MSEPKHTPTTKSPAIDALLKETTGIDRQETILTNQCVTCQSPNVDFRDELSVKEYRISGMCQTCQDAFFGK